MPATEPPASSRLLRSSNVLPGGRHTRLVTQDELRAELEQRGTDQRERGVLLARLLESLPRDDQGWHALGIPACRTEVQLAAVATIFAVAAGSRPTTQALLQHLDPAALPQQVLRDDAIERAAQHLQDREADHGALATLAAGLGASPGGTIDRLARERTWRGDVIERPSRTVPFTVAADQAPYRFESEPTDQHRAAREVARLHAERVRTDPTAANLAAALEATRALEPEGATEAAGEQILLLTDFLQRCSDAQALDDARQTLMDVLCHLPPGALPTWPRDRGTHLRMLVRQALPLLAKTALRLEEGLLQVDANEVRRLAELAATYDIAVDIQQLGNVAAAELPAARQRLADVDALSALHPHVLDTLVDIEVHLGRAQLPYPPARGATDRTPIDALLDDLHRGYVELPDDESTHRAISERLRTWWHSGATGPCTWEGEPADGSFANKEITVERGADGAAVLWIASTDLPPRRIDASPLRALAAQLDKADEVVELDPPILTLTLGFEPEVLRALERTPLTRYTESRPDLYLPDHGNDEPTVLARRFIGSVTQRIDLPAVIEGLATTLGLPSAAAQLAPGGTEAKELARQLRTKRGTWLSRSAGSSSLELALHHSQNAHDEDLMATPDGVLHVDSRAIWTVPGCDWSPQPHLTADTATLSLRLDDPSVDRSAMVRRARAMARLLRRSERAAPHRAAAGWVRANGRLSIAARDVAPSLAAEVMAAHGERVTPAQLPAVDTYPSVLGAEPDGGLSAGAIEPGPLTMPPARGGSPAPRGRARRRAVDPPVDADDQSRPSPNQLPSSGNGPASRLPKKGGPRRPDPPGMPRF